MPTSHPKNSASNPAKDASLCDRRDAHRSAGGGRPTLLVAKGAALVFAGTAGGYVFGYLFFFLVGRTFGPERFGEYIVGLSISRVLLIVCVLGLDMAVVRFVAKYHGFGDTGSVRGMMRLAFRLALPSLFIGGAALWLFSGFLADHVFHQPRMEKMFWGFACAIPFLGLTMLFTAATTALCMPVYATLCRDLGDWVARLLFTLLLMGLGFGFSSVFVGHALAAGVLCAAAGGLFMRLFWNRFRGTTTRLPAADTLAFALPQIVIHLVHMLVKAADVVLLGYFISTQASGIYGAAAQLSIAGSVFLASFSMILSPLISSLHARGQMIEVGRLLKLSTKWALSLALPYYLLLVLFSVPILRVYGHGFEGGSASLLILSGAYLIDTTAGLVYFVLVMSGRQVLEMYYSMALCLLNILLNIWLIPRYGMVGAALATGMAFVGFALVRAVSVYRLYGIHSLSSQICKPLLAGATASVVTLLALRMTVGDGTPTSGTAILLAGVFLLVYGGLLFAGRLSTEDREVLNAVKSRLGLATAPNNKQPP